MGRNGGGVFDEFGKQLGVCVCVCVCVALSLSLYSFYSMGPKIVTKSLGKAFWVEVGMSQKYLFWRVLLSFVKGLFFSGSTISL